MILLNKMIETERLILRPIAIEDAPAVFEWASDPDVNRYLPYLLHEDIQTTIDWINSIRPEDNEFAFCLKDSGIVIGTGSIKLRPETNMYEFGYNFNKKYWGLGYATEAAKALISWAHEILGAKDFCARHANQNLASGKVILKCGLHFVSYCQYKKIDGSEIFESSYYEMHLD